jgi:predicted nucleic acid-binding protein
MKTADASVLIGVMMPSDSHYTASRDWLERQIRAGVVVVLPTLALVELAGGLRRRSGDRVLTRRALRHFRALPNVRIADLDRGLMWRSALLAATLGLRGADAIYVAAAHRYRTPLITWDADQQRRAALIVPARAPSADVP